MDFAVIHTIKDADAWDNAIAAAGENLPAGFSNPVFVVAEDKTRAVCVWHAPARPRPGGTASRVGPGLSCFTVSGTFLSNYLARLTAC
jgi:hypothetical protein